MRWEGWRQEIVHAPAVPCKPSAGPLVLGRVLEAGLGATTLTAVLLQELNERWRSLQQLAEERSQLLGSAHEVQRFHR